MSFKENDCQQLTLNDAVWGLTERESRMLQKSWATHFVDKIFPLIDENKYACLYSEKASRPNTPVNVIIGALIIKELFNLTDDELVESLMSDIRFQYALHTTSFKEQPLSDKTLSRFRNRCYNHELTHGEDLIHDTITELSGRLINIKHKDGDGKFYGKLNIIEKQLMDGKIPFLRIHQSYLVNYRFVCKISFSRVILFDGTILQISEDRQKMIRAKYNDLLGGEFLDG